MADDRQADAVRFVHRAHDVLDKVNYYKLLSLDPKADSSAIRTAYLKIASRLHPDLFGRGIDEAFKQKLTAVYSRVVEAYKVLSDPKRRRMYDTGLKKGKTRMSADAEATPRKRPEDTIRDPGAKRFFKLGMAAMSTGNKGAAKTNFQLALSLEPTSLVIKEALSRALRK